MLVDAYDVLGDCVVAALIQLIKEHEEKVKARHNCRSQVEISAQALLAIIAPPFGIGGREDGRTRIERGLDASLRD